MIRLKIHKTNKIKKYKLYSTISDSDITDWLTFEECRAARFENLVIDLKEKAIEEFLEFPNGFYGIDHKYIRDEEGLKRKLAFSEKIMEKLEISMEAYNKFISDEFDKIMITK